MEETYKIALQQAMSELDKTQRALERLHKDHDALVLNYSHLKYNNIDSIWRYFPSYCNEFQYLPPIDLKLHESAHIAGPYCLGDTIGNGQFSTGHSTTYVNIIYSYSIINDI